MLLVADGARAARLGRATARAPRARAQQTEEPGRRGAMTMQSVAAAVSCEPAVGADTSEAASSRHARCVALACCEEAASERGVEDEGSCAV